MKASEQIQEHTHNDICDKIIVKLQQMNETTQEVIEAIETLQKVVISEMTSSTSFKTRTAETVEYDIMLKNQIAKKDNAIFLCVHLFSPSKQNTFVDFFKNFAIFTDFHCDFNWMI